MIKLACYCKNALLALSCRVPSAVLSCLVLSCPARVVGPVIPQLLPAHCLFRPVPLRPLIVPPCPLTPPHIVTPQPVRSGHCLSHPVLPRSARRVSHSVPSLLLLVSPRPTLWWHCLLLKRVARGAAQQVALRRNAKQPQWPRIVATTASHPLETQTQRRQTPVTES